MPTSPPGNLITANYPNEKQDFDPASEEGFGTPVDTGAEGVYYPSSVAPAPELGPVTIRKWLQFTIDGEYFYAPLFASTTPPPPPPPPPPPSPLRPKFFVGPANAYTSGTEAYLDGATFLTGSSANGKVGSFVLTTSAGNYGWLAFALDISSVGVAVFDGVGTGGWSGAGFAGNHSSGTSTDTSSITHTDSDSITWYLIRQDYVNANPTAGNYSCS